MKDSFDPENISSTASELKYSKKIKDFMSAQLKNPDDNFVRYILSIVYPGTRTQNMVEKFRFTIKNSLNQFVNELMNDKISAALKSEPPQSDDSGQPDINDDPAGAQKTKTTMKELEAFFIIKSLFAGVVPLDKITYKDNESYFSVLYDSKVTKWICRLRLEGNKDIIGIPNENKVESFTRLKKLEDLYNLKDQLIEVVKRYAY